MWIGEIFASWLLLPKYHLEEDPKCFRFMFFILPTQTYNNRALDRSRLEECVVGYLDPVCRRPVQSHVITKHVLVLAKLLHSILMKLMLTD